MATEFVEETSSRARLWALQAKLGHKGIDVLQDGWVIEVPAEFHAGLLLDLLHHGNALPRWCEINLLALPFRSVRMVLNHVTALDVENHGTDQLLSDVHEVIVICIRHVELARCELGVVCEVHALVPEIPADLKYA